MIAAREESIFTREESIFTRRMIEDLEATIDRTLYGDLNAMASTPDTLLLPIKSYNLLTENRMKKSKKKAKKPKTRGITLTFASDVASPTGIAESRWTILDPVPEPSAIEIASSVRHGAKPKKGEARVLATALIDERAKACRLEQQIAEAADRARADKRGPVVERLVAIASGRGLGTLPTIAEQLQAAELLLELAKLGWLIR